MESSKGEDPRRVVALRVFRTNTGTDVTATVYEPVMMRPDQWKCEFGISGLPHPVEDQARGLDSMQALILGLEAIRVRLESIGESLTWFGGEPGEFGIPRSIPNGYGLEVEKHLAKLLNDEVARLVEAKAKSKGVTGP